MDRSSLALAVVLLGCEKTPPKDEIRKPAEAMTSASATIAASDTAKPSASPSGSGSADLSGDHPGDSFAPETFGFGGLGLGAVGSTGSGMGSAGVDPNPFKVKMTDVGTTVVGKLPPQVVTRIVRANYPRLRRCYESGLKTDAGLAGTVTVRFVVDSSGAVESATDAGGTLKNAAVQSCVVGIYRTLAFPEPETGKVTVTVPIEFGRL